MLHSRKLEISREADSKPTPALSTEELLEAMLVELRTMNLHLASITDEVFTELEIQE